MRYWVFIVICCVYGNLFGSYITQENTAIAYALTLLQNTSLAFSSDNGHKDRLPALELIMSYAIDPIWAPVTKCSLKRGTIYWKVNEQLSASRIDRIIILRDFISSWGDGGITRIAIPKQYYFDITEFKNSLEKTNHTIYSQCGNAQICHNPSTIIFKERLQYAEICKLATRKSLLRPFYIIKGWLATRPGWRINRHYDLAGANLRDKKYLDSL